MQVQTVPLTDFVHGHITGVEGRPTPMERGVAEDLERAGLLRIKHAPLAKPRSGTQAEAGKAPDDGAGQPSSASPVAPASPQTTSQSSRHGGRRARRGA